MPFHAMAHYGSMTPDDLVKWMRACGIEEAEFHADGAVKHIKLGPDPLEAGKSLRQASYESPEARARRILLGATGRLVERPEGIDDDV